MMRKSDMSYFISYINLLRGKTKSTFDFTLPGKIFFPGIFMPITFLCVESDVISLDHTITNIL